MATDGITPCISSCGFITHDEQFLVFHTKVFNWMQHLNVKNMNDKNRNVFFMFFLKSLCNCFSLLGYGVSVVKKYFNTSLYIYSKAVCGPVCFHWSIIINHFAAPLSHQQGCQGGKPVIEHDNIPNVKSHGDISRGSSCLHCEYFVINELCDYNKISIWVRSWNCGCLVTCFCLIAKTGNKTATVSWPDPYTYIGN